MSELVDYEVKVLRVAAGEDVAETIAGGAIWQALECLAGRRFVRRTVEGQYQVTDVGRQYLAALEPKEPG